MGSPLRGPHRHRGEEVNHGSLLIIGGRHRTERSSRPRKGARDGRHLGPSPHASSKKEREAAPRIEGQPSTESGGSQSLVLLGDSQRRRRLDSATGHYRGVVFPLSVRSIVLGWTSI